MSEVRIDLKERVQELIQTINTYRGKLQGGSGDTNVEIKNWSLDMAKHDKEYTLGVEFDLTLTTKTHRTESNKQ